MTKKNNDQRSAAKKRVTVVQCGLTQSQESDKKMRPIPLTDRTGAVVGTGSLWPHGTTKHTAYKMHYRVAYEGQPTSQEELWKRY
jgi:hypothetical protein